MQQFAAQEIGARIARCRLEGGGMTQEELAGALNVSKRSVQDYEAGVTIPWKLFARLEQIFPGRTLDWFLHGGAESADPDRLEAIEAALSETRATLDRILRLLEEGQPQARRASG